MKSMTSRPYMLAVLAVLTSAACGTEGAVERAEGALHSQGDAGTVNDPAEAFPDIFGDAGANDGTDAADSMQCAEGVPPLTEECSACGLQQCAAELLACGPDCQGWVRCAAECGQGDLACILDSCGSCDPTPLPEANAALTCLSDACEASCPGLGDTAPAPDVPVDAGLPDTGTSQPAQCAEGVPALPDACLECGQQQCVEAGASCGTDCQGLLSCAAQCGQNDVSCILDGCSSCDLGVTSQASDMAGCLADTCASVCPDFTGTGDTPPEDGGTPLPPEDDGTANASCEGSCGGFAGSCYCDDVCESYGDCCDDKLDVCGAAAG